MIQRALHSLDPVKYYILKTYAYDTQKIFHGLLKSKSSPKSTHFVFEAFPSFRMFYHSVLVFGEDFDFRSPWKIFYVSYA